MNKRTKLVIGALVVIGVVACERRGTELGGKKQQVAAVEYTTVPHESLVAGNVQVAGLMPSGIKIVSGEAVYKKVCAACHQLNGLGVPGAFPPLDGSMYVTGDEGRLVSILVYGLQGPIKVKGVDYNNVMVAMGGAQLSDEEIAAVATYARSSWSNKAEKVETAKVEEVKQKYGTRGPMTAAEVGEES